MTRAATRTRKTKETDIEIVLDVDGPTGVVETTTGLPFFDHMLDQLGRHGGFDLVVRAEGDLAVDAHHTVEDTGLAVGEALAQALGTKAGVRRFASGLFPLDEALVEVALDLSGRPHLAWAVGAGEVGLGSPPFDPRLAEHFWASLVTKAGVTLHVTARTGDHPHHLVEAAFKGTARCLRDAVRVDGGGAVPSTKGVL